MFMPKKQEGITTKGKQAKKIASSVELQEHASYEYRLIVFADNRFGGAAIAFPAFKVSAQKVLF
jgi:hypothetical protein